MSALEFQQFVSDGDESEEVKLLSCYRGEFCWFYTFGSLGGAERRCTLTALMWSHVTHFNAVKHQQLVRIDRYVHVWMEDDLGGGGVAWSPHGGQTLRPLCNTGSGCESHVVISVGAVGRTPTVTERRLRASLGRRAGSVRVTCEHMTGRDDTVQEILRAT